MGELSEKDRVGKLANKVKEVFGRICKGKTRWKAGRNQQ
jgi:hypothetical protein